jgi:hypothetical protein
MTGLSLSAALRSATHTLGGAWRRGWAALAPAALLIAAAQMLKADPLGWVLGVGAVLWIAQAAAVSYRVALGEAPPALAGARVTRDVPRLVVVGVLQLILLAVITALMLTVVGSVAFGIASVGHGFQAAEPATWIPAMAPAGRVIAWMVGALGLAGVTWLAARLALAPAASVDLQAVKVLSVWPTGKGQVLAIVAGSLAAAAPTLAVAWAVALTPLAGGWPADLALALAAVGASLPLHAGLMTYLYRRSTSH